MHRVVAELLRAMNAHDLDAAVALMHEDYRSEQPAHPDLAFTGREQMRANWAAMFSGIPDFRAELSASAEEGSRNWTEWRWSGTRTDGQPVDVRGVAIFDIRDDHIVAGRIYLEDVKREGGGIEAAVQARAGSRPSPSGE